MGVEVLTAAVVALALLPLLAAARDSGSRAVLALAGVTWLVAAVGAGFATHVYREDRPVPIATAIKNRPVEIAMDGYVSSSTCGSCHPHEYATWYDSYHRTMTQVASPKTIAGPWDGIEREREGRSYRFERRGEELWTVVTEPGSATPLERQIVLLTGSHHFQFLWFATGKMRKLGLFEFAYQIAEERWIPVDGMVLAPPGVQQATLEGGGRWNKNCNRCHAVNGKPRVRNANWMDTVVAEFGIACEACHGPGEEHVAKNRDPQRRYQLYLTDDADPTIVQPARLDHARSSQVCGQCHAVQTFRSDRDLERWVWKVKRLKARGKALTGRVRAL